VSRQQTATTAATTSGTADQNDNNKQNYTKRHDDSQPNHLVMVYTMTQTLTSFLVHSQETSIGVPQASTG
jgi:hypothetical protein